MPESLVRQTQGYRAAVLLTLLFLISSAFVASVPVLSSAGAASTAPGSALLHDDFTHDRDLNMTLWQINGTVGSAVGQKDVGNLSSLVMLEPVFSSTGMEIAQVNGRFEVGTIQSVRSFTPPFVVQAVVTGTVSNGHTFGFAVSSADAGSGVLIYGNLNATDCSHLGDCGNPSVCGTPANASVPPDQCYYGIDAKTGRGVGQSWGSKTSLYQTPDVNTVYRLQISVDTSGNAQYSVSQGDQVLGQSSAQIGTGPFYLILEQAEGAPVASGRANQAYWLSVSVAPTVPSSSTTSTSTAPAPLGMTIIILIILAIIIVILFLIILLWYSRRRKFTVTVQDSQSLSPIVGAIVSATGPKDYSGKANDEGQAIFANPKKGDYSIQAKASEYNPSVPETVKVEDDKTKYVVRLDRIDRGQPAKGGVVPSPAPGPQTQSPTPVAQETQPTSASKAAVPPPSQPVQQEPPEFEGWGGHRIREIIRTFQQKGAISPETALTAKELGLSRMFVRIMERRKGKTRVFIEINGRYYLNQDALRETQ